MHYPKFKEGLGSRKGTHPRVSPRMFHYSFAHGEWIFASYRRARRGIRISYQIFTAIRTIRRRSSSRGGDHVTFARSLNFQTYDDCNNRGEGFLSSSTFSISPRFFPFHLRGGATKGKGDNDEELVYVQDRASGIGFAIYTGWNNILIYTDIFYNKYSMDK